MPRTDDHGRELEALPYALPVDLVGQVGKSDVAIELFADDGCATRVLWLGEGRTRAVQLVRAVGRNGFAISGGNVRVRHLCKIMMS